MSCIRDTDRLSDADGHGSSTGSHGLARSENALSEWLMRKLAAGDIAYIGQRDGIAIYRPLKSLHD